MQNVKVGVIGCEKFSGGSFKQKGQDNFRDGLPCSYTEQDGIDFISDMLSSNGNDAFAFPITADNIVIDSIGIFRQDNTHRKTAKLRYYTAEEHWRKGIAAESVRQICEYVFSKRDVIRIYAELRAHHTVSCRLLEKAGFQ